MSASHDHLVSLMKSLKYQANDKGICAGVVEMVILEFLRGNLKRCIDRFHTLSKLSPSEIAEQKKALFNEDSKSRNSLTNQQQKTLIDILAFFDGVKIYARTNELSDVFNRFIPPHETKLLTPYFQSKNDIEKKESRVEVRTLLGIYNEEELKGLFSSLEKALKDNPPPIDFALSLSCGAHKTGLCFSSKKNKWIPVEVNLLEDLEETVDTEVLYRRIMNTFNESMNTAFVTKIITTTKNQEQLKKIMDDWSKSDEYKIAQGITADKAARMTDRNESLVWHAARVNDLETLQKALEYKTDINQVDSLGFTPAAIATQNGNTAALRLLAKHGADLNIPINSGLTLAHLAMIPGSVDLIRILLENGAKLDVERKSDGSTPIGLAVVLGYAPVVQILAENKVDLNKVMNDGNTLSHVAAHLGHSEVLRVLAKNGAKLNVARTTDGVTPAYVAAHMGHPKVIRVLSEHKVDLNQPTSKGATPAEVAAYYCHFPVLYELVDAGVDLQKQSKDFITYLGKHHLFPENFVKECSDPLNKKVPERMDAIKPLNKFIVENKEKKQQDKYLQYKNEINKVDHLAHSIMLMRQEFKNDIPEKLSLLEKFVHDEYKAISSSLEKKPDKLADHDEILRKKIDEIKKTLVVGPQISTFPTHAQMQNQKLIQFIDAAMDQKKAIVLPFVLPSSGGSTSKT